ncbi:MAG TPA: hypothetical protein VMB27_26795 [Solirubrobacteraceae bacterium]|nr:hypothetical protein [Solirubrobacteraceae bacterium]
MSTEPSPGRARSPRWRIERTLADELSDPLLEHDTLLIAIAVAFGTPTDPRQLWEWLDDAARPLFGEPVTGLRDRAEALATLMTRELGFVATPDRYEGLLLDHAISTCSGHPLLLATVGHELARRAGWTSVTARTSDRYWTVLTGDGYFTPIAYEAAGAPLDPSHLRTCCPHELSHAILTAIAREAPADVASSATRIRSVLPFEPDDEREAG